jgi:hypothetical protein
MQNIKIKITTSYGNKRIYIVDDTARHINQLTGKTTISREDISALESLGFTFTVEAPKL